MSGPASGPGAAEEATYDAVVLGSGVAGCATALQLARRQARVALVTKGTLGESTTRYAQGGIAVALSGTGDRPEDHLADTLRAGAGLCDPAATRALVEGAPAAVEELLAWGARLDREPDGQLARSREGGHGVARVVHAGGAATGAEVVRTLTATLAASPVVVHEGWLARGLLVERGRCVGVEGLDGDGRPARLRAGAVVLATGGAGQLYAVTTSPAGATGDGLALALAAGVPLADLELVQFHPTALAVDTVPRPLLSEALRGEGALLVGRDGRRFVDELAPRDVVARAIARQMAADGADHVYLDARLVQGFGARFGSLASALGSAGLDAERDLLPVAPAAHYLCGGVLTDLDGASALPGCYAVGETACTGVHGANRLASNSLLEGLVFARRVASAIVAGAAGPAPSGALGPLLGCGDEAAVPVRTFRLPPEARAASAPPAAGAPASEADELAAIRVALAQAMSAGAGVERDAPGLRALASTVAGLRGRLGALSPSPAGDGPELAHLLELGAAIAALALAREESRGAHFRRDHPETLAAWRCRLAVVGETAPVRSGAPEGRKR